MRSATHATIPLFPLNTVLFPGGPLRLRIFEPRYLDMVSRCMREDAGFGVALIVAGREAGGAAQTVAIGTLARIVDFDNWKTDCSASPRAANDAFASCMAIRRAMV
jgi:Lon protease-like protein